MSYLLRLAVNQVTMDRLESLSYRLRSAGGFNFGEPSELKYHNVTLPTTAMTSMTPTIAIRTAILTVLFNALNAMYATARKTSRNAAATIMPMVPPLGAI